MSLSKAEKRKYKAQAHSLKPVVTIGIKGVTQSLLEELDLSLEHHQLLKLKLTADDAKQRLSELEQCCEKVRAELVAVTGKVAILYRRRNDD